ncbi:formyltetrahydrofolate deformylase [Aquipuribacter hungaricus]|uniref:Formyltetrahydrofolate deformylase n=1 Tax=Aquipuribacter hungaricus TaxID=545624 RepID=A0ABV7WHM2_9MICO
MTASPTGRPAASTTASATASTSTPAAEPHYVLTLSCPDRPGIVHAVTGALLRHHANVTESQQFGDPDTRLFFLRVQFTCSADPARLDAALRGAAEEFDFDWQLHPLSSPVRTLIMVSRAGHCLNDLLYRHRAGRLPIDPVAVVSNHEDLAGLAGFYEVPFSHVPVTPGDPASKDAAEERLLRTVDELDVELVVLARYMQVLSPRVCEALAGRAINIHHSFLPSFAGARPYHQAHTRGVKLIGATAHYVTADLDEGPIIEQDVERVDHSHAVDDLVGLGQDLECRALARAVRWHAERRVLVDRNRTVVFR